MRSLVFITKWGNTFHRLWLLQSWGDGWIFPIFVAFHSCLTCQILCAFYLVSCVQSEVSMLTTIDVISLHTMHYLLDYVQCFTTWKLLFQNACLPPHTYSEHNTCDMEDPGTMEIMQPGKDVSWWNQTMSLRLKILQMAQKKWALLHNRTREYDEHLQSVHGWQFCSLYCFCGGKLHNLSDLIQLYQRCPVFSSELMWHPIFSFGTINL